jgi:hypothetical protein
MTTEENLYKTIKARSNYIIKHGVRWKKEISSAKNYIATPDLKSWTFAKSAGLDNEYHAKSGTAKLWLYSIGFINVLQLPDSRFKKRVVNSFLNWANKVRAFNINKKFDKDQSKNKHFEILIHNTLVPKLLLQETNISKLNQAFFNEGFRKEIIKEVAVRDKKVIELARLEFGSNCEVCKFDFGVVYGAHGEGFIEMHHLYPIALGERKTVVGDLRPVCSNCHRMLHKGDRLLAISELKKIVERQKLNTNI